MLAAEVYVKAGILTGQQKGLNEVSCMEAFAGHDGVVLLFFISWRWRGKEARPRPAKVEHLTGQTKGPHWAFRRTEIKWGPHN